MSPFARKTFWSSKTDEPVLRNSPDDQSQRMLNALEPGTILPIHWHHTSSETVVILRGRIQWVFYDEAGNETARVTLDANVEPRMLNVEKDRWHSLVCLEEGSVLFKCKAGPYRPLEEEEVMEVEREKRNNGVKVA